LGYYMYYVVGRENQALVGIYSSHYKCQDGIVHYCKNTLGWKLKKVEFNNEVEPYSFQVVGTKPDQIHNFDLKPYEVDQNINIGDLE